MKFKRLSVQLGLSFALISGLATMPTPVQADQLSTDITTDFSEVLPTDTVETDFSTDFIDLLNTLIDELKQGTKFQQELALLLTDPNEADRGFILRQLNAIDGVNGAGGLVNTLAGALTGSPEEQANKLVNAIITYNDLVRSLETETLQNPPQSFIEIYQLLFEIATGAATGDD